MSLTEKQLLWVTIGVSILLVIGLGLLSFFDLKKKGELEDKLSAVEGQLQEARRKVEVEYPRLQQEWLEKAPEMGRLGRMVPDRESLDGFLDMVHDVEREVNRQSGAQCVLTVGKFEDFKPESILVPGTDPKAGKLRDVLEREVEVTVEGNYLGFVRLVEALENEARRANGGRIMRVTEFQTTKGMGSVYKAKISFYKMLTDQEKDMIKKMLGV
jgi:hypothetical protein